MVKESRSSPGTAAEMQAELLGRLVQEEKQEATRRLSVFLREWVAFMPPPKEPRSPILARVSRVRRLITAWLPLPQMVPDRLERFLSGNSSLPSRQARQGVLATCPDPNKGASGESSLGPNSRLRGQG